MVEDEMIGWHPQLNGHEFEQTLGVSETQESLVGHSPLGCKESDMTERLNNSKIRMQIFVKVCIFIQVEMAHAIHTQISAPIFTTSRR